jgi:hypothetical protein
MSDELIASDLSYWAERIRGHMIRTVESIIATGEELIAAKAAVGHGNWLPLLKLTGMSATAAERLMAVATSPLAKSAQRGILPAAVTTLYELTHLDPDEFDQAVEIGAVHPDMRRRDAHELVHAVTASSALAWNGEVHPVLAIWPAYEPWAKLSLARSIKRHGLDHPGVLLPDGTMLDGRERRQACELVGVPMRWEVRDLDDRDAARFVLSVNAGWGSHAYHLARAQAIVDQLTELGDHPDDLADAVEILDHCRVETDEP